MYDAFLEGGFVRMVEKYTERLWSMNQSVSFTRRGHRSTGVVVDVQDGGGLVVRVRGGRLLTLYDEEVTLQ
jgi:biotin-(acetyl-CoA carboxylase) ligase